MISENIKNILSHNKNFFVFVATSDRKGRPNGASKLLIRVEDDHLYLLDYPAWQTWQNLRENPKISISFTDVAELKCYKINGTVEIIESGPIHDQMREEVDLKMTTIAAKQIVEGLHDDKDYKNFEDNLPERFILYNVKVDETDEMTFAKTPKM